MLPGVMLLELKGGLGKFVFEIAEVGLKHYAWGGTLGTERGSGEVCL